MAFDYYDWCDNSKWTEMPDAVVNKIYRKVTIDGNVFNDQDINYILVAEIKWNKEMNRFSPFFKFLLIFISIFVRR